MSNDPIIAVSIIEDSEIHREWLKAELESDNRFKIVSIDYIGRKGFESVKSYDPAIVLLDFQLEDMTGLEVSKRIKLYNEKIKIFIITAHTEISIIERLINDKNIDAIAIKGSRYFEDNFKAAINDVINGGTYLDPSLLKKLRESKNIGGLSDLTKREFEVFIQANSGKSDAKIAEDLYIELAHVKNIKSKINKKIKNADNQHLLRVGYAGFLSLLSVSFLQT
jgi:DNA-binding NarL/FixJ family response regulator